MQGKNFDIPVFEWFYNGGKYSGCKRLPENNDFNYRITPLPKESKLTVDLWRGVYCFEKSEPTDYAEFEFSDSGLASAINYIDSAVEKLDL
jgi:hypothetical protein